MLRTTRLRFTSGLALAVALAGGTVMTSALVAPAAVAQDYTDAFVELYQPVAAIVNAEGGDVNSVTGQFPAIVAAAVTPDDKFAVGNLILIAGNKLSRPALQRQGLELQLASGKVAPENIGMFNWFVGNLAVQGGDFLPARAALQAAAAAGYTQGDTTALIAETYYEVEGAAAGVAYVLQSAQARLAAGGEVPENWLLRGLRASYGDNLTNEANALSLLLVTQHTSRQNWLNALQVANSLNDYDDQARLDLLRLMRLTETMTAQAEFIAYIEAADPRIMSNEVVDVLAAAEAANLFVTGEDRQYYADVLETVNSRMAGDRADAPSLVRDARTAGTGADALLAGNLLYSLDDFAGAEEMFALAVTKGGSDTQTALTRQGIAQVRQGNHAAAVATLAQVTGPREAVAKFWSAYAQSQAAAAPVN